LIVRYTEPSIFTITVAQFPISKFDIHFKRTYSLYEYTQYHDDIEKITFTIEAPSTGAEQGYCSILQDMCSKYHLGEHELASIIVCTRTQNAKNLTLKFINLIEKYMESKTKNQIDENPHIAPKKKKEVKK
jgi:hypothetical protein